MKELLIFLLMLSILPICAVAESVDTVWSYTDHFSSFCDAIALDDLNNLYLVGKESDGISDDYYLIKLYPNGDVAWTRQYDGEAGGWDFGKDVCVGPSGNVYVTGLSTKSGPDEVITTIAYNEDGDTLWVRDYNGPGTPITCYEQGNCIAVDGDENIYVAGKSTANNGFCDYTLIKYRPNGSTAWVRTYGGIFNHDDEIKAMAIDEAGNIYVTGWSEALNAREAATVKYDSLGNQIWASRYNYPGGNDNEGSAIVVDNGGNVYVGGYAFTGPPFLIYGFLTIKYNASGDTVWTRIYDPYGTGRAWDIAVDNEGNVYVTGESNGPGISGSDYATIKYDSNGNPLWISRYDKSGADDYAYGLDIDNTHNVYVTGMSDQDAFTIKYDPDGDTLWTARVDSAKLYGIIVNEDGSLLVGGSTEPLDRMLAIKYQQQLPGYIVVTNLDASGPGSLRWAIDSANSDPQNNGIIFAVSGTIALSTGLPAVTDNHTDILGETAPDGPRSVILDGAGAAGDNSGLLFFSDSNIVQGLTLINWSGVCLGIDGNANTVRGCHINVNSAGDTRMAGTGEGISVSGRNNIIGGPSVADRNIIAPPDNSFAVGIGSGALNSVCNNYIGLTASGIQLPGPFSGSTRGIFLSNVDSNTVGDTALPPNYIAAVSIGIYVMDGIGNEIANNVLGLDVNLSDTVANGIGIVFSGTCRHNTIGLCNIIAGSDVDGIYFPIGADSNYIRGNTIIGNGGEGLIFTSGPKYNIIGGWETAEANIISNNGENGIHLYANSDSNRIIGNILGGNWGNPDGGNSGNGIMIDLNCDYNYVSSNIIGYNGDDGISVEINSLYNTITRNRIFENGELGIDLNDDGVTANDPGDLDNGPNGLLNFPVIDSVRMNPDSSFTVWGFAQGAQYVEFFLAHPGEDTGRPADPSGYGEAYEFVAADTMPPLGQFAHVIPRFRPFFAQITAITIDTLGNTSEFCNNFTLIPAPLIILAYGFSPSIPKGEMVDTLINMIVTDPEGYIIGKDSDGNLIQSLFPASYDEVGLDSVTIPIPKLGEYQVEIVGASDNPSPGATYSVGVQIDGSLVCAVVADEAVPTAGFTDTVTYLVEEGWHYGTGDANGDNKINILDITFLINYVYKGGPAPDPRDAGDANCNEVINILDITYLISYLYKGGDPPCKIC
jgi:hypothetical protein